MSFRSSNSSSIDAFPSLTPSTSLDSKIDIHTCLYNERHYENLDTNDEQQISIRHIIMESIKNLHEEVVNAEEPGKKVSFDEPCSLKMSSKISVVSTRPMAPWQMSSQSHDNFEVTPYLRECLQRQGYHLGPSIGHGTYGKVYRATFDATIDQRSKPKSWESKKVYAVKVMDKQRLSIHYKSKFLCRELKALHSMKPHENIVHFYEMFAVKQVIDGKVENNLLTTIMEYCPRGDVFEYICKRPNVPEPLARRWFVQLLAAVGHMHEQGFAHRDLKTENLLLDEAYVLRVTDFGFCLPLYAKNHCNCCEQTSTGLNKRSCTFAGSRSYCSPELLLADPYNVTLNDVWACGVILYVLLFNFYPIDVKLLEKMDQFDYSMIEYSHEPHITPECLSVLQRIFQPEEFRGSVAQLRQLDWIAQYSASDFTEALQDPEQSVLEIEPQKKRSFKETNSKYNI